MYGFIATILEAIVDHNNDDSSVDIADKYEITTNGSRSLRMTNQGWKLKILWRNGAEHWLSLKDLKNPILLK